MGTADINYWNFARKIAQKDCTVVEIRYYVGKVSVDLDRSRKQRVFLSGLRKQNVNVTLGRVERRPVPPEKNTVQKKLANILSAHRDSIQDTAILGELEALAAEETSVYTEKRVDVSIAVDMVSKAMNNEFDVAYLVSADGDFIPAVDVVRQMKKQVFAAGPVIGRELQKAVNSFIRLPKEWFSGDVFLKSSA